LKLTATLFGPSNFFSKFQPKRHIFKIIFLIKTPDPTYQLSLKWLVEKKKQLFVRPTLEHFLAMHIQGSQAKMNVRHF